MKGWATRLDQEYEKLAEQKVLANVRVAGFGMTVGSLSFSSTGKSQMDAISKESRETAAVSIGAVQLADKVAVDVIVAANKRRESIQFWYEICTWISYCLYALGWGLGLAGRVVGVKGIGGSAD